jgi:hypothetical protein
VSRDVLDTEEARLSPSDDNRDCDRDELQEADRNEPIHQ